ncbi:quinolinate synthase [Serinibacter arcticus]|uniref:Quinolinate synthase n=1 Tax=Serinibacter arcticus TaxID=1655435 RepID=A0A2U1ZTI0_9MICO|nr:quinolinate synthase NadA [Serinibacter arcticus]PWD50232.1 quinolinate synthase [Serinibacter arcticus]
MTSVAELIAVTTISGTTAASTCDTDLAEPTWAFDALPTYGPGASVADPIPVDTTNATMRPGQLPLAYQKMSDEELHARIVAARETLGDRIVILGHYYQRDEIVAYADFVGDSFQLANAALTRPDAEAIVFCGVHFMAETADILARDEQHVILPNLAAGCSMADMADSESVEAAWEELAEVYGFDASQEIDEGWFERNPGVKLPVIPVTYMNSSAALKAFCGRHGGIVCTSSNARTVLEWAFERGERVLFFPDQHLGRNTAKAMGVPLEQMPMWNPRKDLGGNTSAELDDARVILWHGFCSVHKRFTTAQIDAAREQHPGVQVVVHPECPMPVVDAADAAGSTELIRRFVAEAAPGSTIAIGTEVNMVNRLAAQHPDKTIFCLDPVICPCSTMYRIHPGYLAWTLEGLVEGEWRNEIQVDPDVATHARVALTRMLAAAPQPLGGTPAPAAPAAPAAASAPAAPAPALTVSTGGAR